MIARSATMLRIFSLIEHLRESDATVLVTGESGTGKELVARALHRYSPRRGGRFVAVNCGALPTELLESELFGHVRGAFTGAVRDRVGRFELATGGTLFLDEIGELPLPLQVKLLRVLQEHTFERVGESAPRTTDARIIAATNLDLQRAILHGELRDDLYYRLRVVPIEVPPLRHRREDVEPLAEHLLEKLADRKGRSLRLAPGARRALLGYDWPGNVRELENALEYAIAVCPSGTIHDRDLPPEVANAESPAPHPKPTAPDRPPNRPPTRGLDSEAQALRTTLDAHQWRRDATARALGLSRTTLWRKMREHHLLES
jgi:DNA-binding NtrC family response regulator